MKIGLLVGGASPEREVSIESCKSIYSALNELGHEVILSDPALGKKQHSTIEDYFITKRPSDISEKNYLNAVELLCEQKVSMVFNGLHGEFGEDGKIQALLDLAGIPYTGAGVLSSSLAMDKEASKIMFKHFGVNTAEWILFHYGKDSVEGLGSRIRQKLGFPCIVKPNNQGSTIGLTLCDNESTVEDAINLAGKYSRKIIIEEYIDGAEIAVGVLVDKELPLCKIIPSHKLYDYECKYTEGKSKYEVPAILPNELTAELKRLAGIAYKSVECESYGRVDFRLRQIDSKPFCLEVNTLPGMTIHSLVPKMAKAAGISFKEMINIIVNDSFEKA